MAAIKGARCGPSSLTVGLILWVLSQWFVARHGVMAQEHLWSPWSMWSACSVSCGQGGLETRLRTCVPVSHAAASATSQALTPVISSTMPSPFSSDVATSAASRLSTSSRATAGECGGEAIETRPCNPTPVACETSPAGFAGTVRICCFGIFLVQECNVFGLFVLIQQRY